jgi:hypothetical protein
MKITSQIAKECGVSVDLVNSINLAYNVTSTKIKGKYIFNKDEEDLMHRILYFSYRIQDLTIESKLNYSDYQTQEEIMDNLKIGYQSFRLLVRKGEIKEEGRGYFSMVESKEILEEE